MDAKFIKGMLSNHNVQPNAIINCWIAVILLFDFILVHVPTNKHTGPDGLSRHEPISGEDKDRGNPEEWIDKILSLGIWIDTWQLVQSPTSLPIPPYPTLKQPTAMVLVTTRARARERKKGMMPFSPQFPPSYIHNQFPICTTAINGCIETITSVPRFILSILIGQARQKTGRTRLNAQDRRKA
jgi:hypothetical protein